MSRFAVVVFSIALSAVGCSSIPPRDDPSNWYPFETPSQISGEYFSDLTELVLRFRFIPEVSDVYAVRALDIPGNGLDQYTREGVSVTMMTDGRYELRLPRHYQVGYQLFFFLHWKTPASSWRESQGFLLENNDLFYFSYD